MEDNYKEGLVTIDALHEYSMKIKAEFEFLSNQIDILTKIKSENLYVREDEDSNIPNFDIPVEEVPLQLTDIYVNEQGFTHQDYVDTSTRWRGDSGDATHRLNYSLTKDSVVFDVGGYLGVWANDICCKYGCKIYIYEPVPMYADVLQNKFSHNENIKVFGYGLAHTDASTVMSITGEGSSLIQDAAEHVEVEVRDVVAEIREKDLYIDLLKINIEGAEYLLLERLLTDRDLMNRIDNIQIQFHIWTKNYELRRENIRTLLSMTHELTYDYPFIWENWKKKSYNE